MKRWMLITAMSLVAACGSDDRTGDDASKADEASQDYCAAFGWYGDGHCDEVCARPDPDCEEPPDGTPVPVPGGDDAPDLPPPDPGPGPDPDPNPDPDPSPPPPDPGPGCDGALLACGPGYMAVDAMTCLAAGDGCYSETGCGDWVHCLYVGEVCPDVEGQPATCPDNMFPVDACQSAECVIARGSGDACTEVAFCEASTQCLALPSCAGEQLYVSTEDCMGRGDTCDTHTICGQTIHCIDVRMDCPEAEGLPPTCPDGKVDVGWCDTRSLNDGTCELVFGSDDQCSSYLYCSIVF